MFGQGSSGPPSPFPSLLQPPSSSAWEPALPARSGFSVYRSGENEGFRVGRCGNSGLVTFFAWLAAAALPVDMEVGSRLLVLRLLFKLLMSSRFFAFSARIHTNKRTDQSISGEMAPSEGKKDNAGSAARLRLSPDSASLSDSLSSSELELLEALAWPGGAASSSSSSAGPLGSGGCFSRSCRQIFSLLLIREIEVLRGRGQGRVEEQQQVTCKGGRGGGGS